MARPQQHDLEDRVIALLAAHPKGMSAAALRSQLHGSPSPSTLTRRLLDLRARGKVVVEGRARSTRYRLASGNALPELRSRLLHEAVARRLVRDPALLDRASKRLERLRSLNPSARRYHDRWQSLIAGPRENLLRTLGEDSEASADLRQESPFTTLLDRAERERVLHQLRA